MRLKKRMARKRATKNVTEVSTEKNDKLSGREGDVDDNSSNSGPNANKMINDTLKTIGKKIDRTSQ